MENTYLCLGWCFMGVLRVFHEYFEGASRSFHECFQKDSNISVLCFKGVLRCFYKKKGLLLCIEVMAATHEISIGQKYPKNTLGTPVTYSRIIFKHSWNNFNVHLKTHELAWKHPWAAQETPRQIQIHIFHVTIMVT